MWGENPFRTNCRKRLVKWNCNPSGPFLTGGLIVTRVTKNKKLGTTKQLLASNLQFPLLQARIVLKRVGPQLVTEYVADLLPKLTC